MFLLIANVIWLLLIILRIEKNKESTFWVWIVNNSFHFVIYNKRFENYCKMFSFGCYF
ncbi:MAG: hypothetical protein ABIH18_07920 [Candidatus Omnitrophota bacterium]